jgi:hypothetical protein
MTTRTIDIYIDAYGIVGLVEHADPVLLALPGLNVPTVNTLIEALCFRSNLLCPL